MIAGERFDMEALDATELFERYRPQTLDDVIGQPTAVAQLKDWLENRRIPHAVLFTGPKGTGKTSLARILRNEMGCTSDLDRKEFNAADKRGVDDVRELDALMGKSPVGGACRVAILDECHQYTPEAQSALLKVLEPSGATKQARREWAFHFLCTTETTKIKSTVRDRCTEIKLEPIPNRLLGPHVQSICKAENARPLSETVLNALLDSAEGSARGALRLLKQVLSLKTDEERLEILAPPILKQNAFDLVGALFKLDWTSCVKILNAIEGEDTEPLRRMILSAATSAISKQLAPYKSAGRYAAIINAFRYEFFSVGKGGLYAACYEVISGAQ